MADPTMTVPSVADQFAAVLNAPLPFALAFGAALSAVWFAVWHAYKWRYEGMIEKTRTLWELAEHDAKAAKTREAELKNTVELLTNELSDKDAELADKLARIDKLATRAATQVEELEKANTIVSETLRRGAISSGAPVIIQGRMTFRS